LCGEAEIDSNAYETWAEVAELLSPEENESLIPEKGDIVSYKPPRAKKQGEYKVTSVSDDKTCNLESLDTGKAYGDVSWDKLSEVE